MARVCVICNKQPQATYNVSNAHNRTKRWVYPNVHVMRFTLKGAKRVQRGAVCSKCVKCGKVEKVL